MATCMRHCVATLCHTHTDQKSNKSQRNEKLFFHEKPPSIKRELKSEPICLYMLQQGPQRDEKQPWDNISIRKILFLLTKPSLESIFLLLRGAVAQLARVLEWHSRGPGFDSPQLHHFEY